MSDIRYKWKNDKAVGIEEQLKLPQFEISGHDQLQSVITLSTGECDDAFSQFGSSCDHDPFVGTSG